MPAQTATRRLTRATSRARLRSDSHHSAAGTIDDGDYYAGVKSTSAPSKHGHSTPPPPVACHALPMHAQLHSSPLSAESPEQNYRGFRNLALLLLFVNNVRLIIENYLKYGLLLFSPAARSNGSSLNWRADMAYCLLLCTLLPCSLLLAHCIEVAALHASRVISSTVRSGMYVVLVLAVLLVPNWVGYYRMDSPPLIFIPSMMSAILTLKLVSYALVQAELRSAYLAGTPIADYGEDMVYPRNITVANIMYFGCAPTLCYQPSYPRSPRFRKGFFLKRVFELISLVVLMYFLAEQYSRPTLQNSMVPFSQLNLFSLAERLLKLSIPSLYIWLLMFYAVFHSYLNMVAELLRFGDRQFYKPWWNAQTISEYWRWWNLPVYQWVKRHIYLPFIIKHRLPPFVAGAFSFFLSAIGHEILAGVPTHVVEGWAFWGMMSQIPLMMLSEKVHRWEMRWRGRQQHKRHRRNSLAVSRSSSTAAVSSDGDVDVGLAAADSTSADDLTLSEGKLGNYMFWVSFCIVGQPLSLLLYYRAWYIRTHPELATGAAA